ncbi:STAS domain-containing protein [Thalassotalea euphylliae]|uniref:STAS domain-containing protein n=1 Tax=Thalassotalea euphylliae TaxID=1655234 RepID=A0A3E0TQ01_9GAMM|nr:STAS domain-containing protein [Thalassotalea euphylliae]REL26578.1 STAS domain-containing protein [Thalassotalea euphylliae]
MFKLPAEITIAKAEEFKQLLMDYAENHDSIEIDDSAVEKIDTIGVQLILSMVTYLTSIHKSIDWQCSTPIIKEGVEKLGIKDSILLQYVNA